MRIITVRYPCECPRREFIAGTRTAICHSEYGDDSDAYCIVCGDNCDKCEFPDHCSLDITEDERDPVVADQDLRDMILRMRYAQNLSINEITDRFKSQNTPIPRQFIYETLRKAGCIPSRHSADGLMVAIREAHNVLGGGCTQKDVADYLFLKKSIKISKSRVCVLEHMMGGIKRKAGARKKTTPPMEQEMVNLYFTRHLTKVAIADHVKDKFGIAITPQHVGYIIKRSWDVGVDIK